MSAKYTSLTILFLLCVVSMNIFATTNQGNFRWRNDDGSESAATWRQSQSTNDTLTGINNIRLRVELYNTDPSNGNFGTVLALFYSTDNSTYTQITTDGSLNHWKLNLSDNFADGDTTTNQLTTSYTFASGNIYESSTTFSATIGPAASKEYEFCISPTSNTVSGTTYYFKIKNSANSDITSYGTIPTLHYVSLATTGSATAVGLTSATVNGSVHPQGLSTTAHFLYGTTYGTYTDSVEADESPVSGSSLTPVSKSLSGLTAGTTYYYLLAKDNTNGYLRTNAASFTTLASEPTTVSHSASTSDAGNLSKTVRWTNGSGSSHIVLMKNSSAVNADPVDGTIYAANSAFGSGTQIGSGNYVVAISTGAQGTQDSVTVTNLDAGTTYFAVYELNGSSGSENYLTSSKLTGNFYLEKDNGPYSLTFDGSGDYVLSSTSLGNFGAGDFTIELWAKTTTPSTVLLGKRYEGSHGSFFVFSLDGSGNIGMELDQDAGGTNYSATSGNTSITDGNWHHVAFTRSGTTLTYYVDGIEDSVHSSVSVASISNSTALSIGVRSVDGSYVGQFFNGLMDDIRIWNVARTQSEISSNKDTELTGTESNLLAYWRNNEGAGGKVYDYTTNAYNGTLYGNTAWSSDVPSITPLNLTYSSSTFNESGANIGSINNSTPMIIVLSGADTFTGSNNDDFVAGGKITVTNLPSGLTVVATRVSAETLSVTITGTAANHASANSVSNLTFAFQNSAFVGNNAGNVTNSTKNNLAVTFLDPVENALSFDGSDDVVSVPASSSINLSQGTWEAWMKVNSLGHHNRIIFKEGADNNGKYELYILDNSFGGSIRSDVVVGGSRYTVSSSVNATTGTWTHIAATFDSTDLKIYVNGVLRGTTSISGAPAGIDANSGPLGIGGNVDGGASSLLEGAIDEVRIWNIVRTESEISADMNNTNLSPSTTGLQAYYQFNHGTAGGTNTGITTLYDATSNANNGTLNNFALTGASSNYSANDNAALPVELTSFTVAAKGSGVELAWRTATEVNNYGFEVERKQIPLNPPLQGESRATGDAGGFVKIGFVEGNGTSNAPKEYSFTDKINQTGKPAYAAVSAGRYSYRLKQIDRDGKFSYSQEIEVEVGSMPKTFALEQNYPNPFNPTTTIGFTLQNSGLTTLKVYDALGRVVAILVNEHLEAGVQHQRIFNGSDLSSGIYFYTLTAGNFSATKKLLLMK